MISTALAGCAVVGLAAACWLLGREVVLASTVRPGEPRPAPGLLLETLTGLVILHLTLTALQAGGILWSRASIVLALAAVGGAAGTVRLLRRRATRGDPVDPPATTLPALRWGWGDALAGLATAAVLAAAFTLRSVHPDFVYHWGVKGMKFWLAGGVDFAYLAHPWNHYAHPDYPNLLPELYATAAILAGGFHEPVLVAASALFFAGLWLAVRDRLGHSRLTPSSGQAGVALVALATGAFTLGYRQAGGADLMIALAVLAAPLSPTERRPETRQEERRGELALGVAAAFAAASKIEGVPLAVFLLGAGLLWGPRRCTPAGLARQLALPTLVVGSWAALCASHGLFQPTNTGALDLSRWPVILEGLHDSLSLPRWHGFPWMLLLLPALLVPRPSRALAAVVLAQLGFYLFVYFTTPVDVAVYLATSLPRLLLHLVPAALVAVLVALPGASPRGAASS